MNTTKIRKIGNSLGVILPADVINTLGLADGSELLVQFERQGNPPSIVLSPMTLGMREFAKDVTDLLPEHWETLAAMDGD